MTSSVKKFALAAGIVTGAILTLTAFTGKTGKKAKTFFTQKFNKPNADKREANDHESYYV